jgi:hypothetical protein
MAPQLATLRQLVLTAVSSVNQVNQVNNQANTSDIFTTFQTLLDDYVEHLPRQQTATLADLSQITTKAKGDLFELLCLYYLKHYYHCDQVYFQADVPAELRQYLGLGRGVKDMGIDLVAYRASDSVGGTGWLAIQCKYRKIAKSKVVNANGARIRVDRVPWSELATFYALCERTGPPGGWSRRIVMTTANGVNRPGRGGPKDVNICAGTWRGLTAAEWYQLVEVEGRTLAADFFPPRPVKTAEEIRQLRLARFG